MCATDHLNNCTMLVGTATYASLVLGAFALVKFQHKSGAICAGVFVVRVRRCTTANARQERGRSHEVPATTLIYVPCELLYVSPISAQIRWICVRTLERESIVFTIWSCGRRLCVQGAAFRLGGNTNL